MKHKECLNELEKISNEKANAEATYKNKIREFEESINQQNEDTKAFYILWKYSQILREEAAPINLKKKYLELKDET